MYLKIFNIYQLHINKEEIGTNLDLRIGFGLEH